MKTDKYVNSEIEEVKRAKLLYEMKFQQARKHQIWLAPGVPSVVGAVLDIAVRKGIVPLKTEFEAPKNGVHRCIVTAKQDGGATRIGAASSKDKRAVPFLAYRNAVRQLIINEDENHERIQP